MDREAARRPGPFWQTAVAAAVASLFAWHGPAHSLEFDTGNPDLKLRWDNTVRYNLGLRARDCDINICGNGQGAGDVVAHQSDRKFEKRGDIVTNRLDLLTEADIVYKEKTGLRVSAAGWYDQAYHDTSVKGDPLFLSMGINAFPTGSYTDYIRRYNRGPSGEFLDAFAFTTFDAGNVPVSVRLGQHNVYWGESLFSFVGGVAYGQGPVDIRKALANPGSEAKELFKPLTQLSLSAAVTDRVTLAGQYFLDWKPSTLPDGGTYFGPADFFTIGGGTVVPIIPPNGAVFAGANEPNKKRGDWGLALKWRPEALDATMGFYVRKYTDKLPQMVIDGVNAAGQPVISLDYKTPRQTLYGLSIAKQVAGVSVGADVTYRKDAQIGAVAFAPVASALGVVPAGAEWRPRGDVFTALVNGVAYFGKNPAFDSAVLIAELNYSRLRKVTFDPFNFWFGLPANCAGAPDQQTLHGCPTKDAWGIAMQFEPKWFQVFSGVDISAPLFVGVGLKGNSPVPFGDNKGQGSYSIGVTADAQNKYNVSLKYNGFLAKHSNDAAGVLSNSNASLGKFWDRNWVSLTFKTTF